MQVLTQANEKYIGKVLMQKTYTPDFLTGRQVKNKDQLEMVLVENAHEPIIDQDNFDKGQEMKGRIKQQLNAESAMEDPIGSILV